MAGTTRAIPFITKLVNERGHSEAYPIQAYSTDPAVHIGFDQFQHLQVGEGEQVHIPAGRVHSVATLGPRVCLSLYSTSAFAKGKKDKAGEEKKVVEKAGDEEMADTSTKEYQRLKWKYRKEAKEPEVPEEGEEKQEEVDITSSMVYKLN